MTNPFSERTRALSDPARDIVQVVPSDTDDLENIAVGIYAQTAGEVALVTVSGRTRVIAVAAFMLIPVGVSRILSSGTTATGIHAFTAS